ncbi:hypothetical protein F5B18DRAFT_670849 [Nemania serpens]|nr:hypothetical protein F5B18DRAFT_670849 [Nemania serpens]
MEGENNCGQTGVGPIGSGYVEIGQSYDPNFEEFVQYWLSDNDVSSARTFSSSYPTPPTRPQPHSVVLGHLRDESLEQALVSLQYPDQSPCHALSTQLQHSQEHPALPLKPIRVKPFGCVCGRYFEYKKDFVRHVRSKHPNDGDPVFKCRCGKADPRKDNHKRHVKGCAKACPVGNAYTCTCGRRYANFNEYLGEGSCICARNP